jgi:glycosyltransferase involved in cell wall biosynthesis/ubiquinone/menaquinone biosynthesis C-methylase UbiE
MKIAIVSTDDIYGGAAIAAYRLHQALLKAGAESTMVVKNKHSSDPSVVVFGGGEEIRSDAPPVLNAPLAEYYITKNRPLLGNFLLPTFFSFDLDEYDLSANSIILQADIINIHWCSGFLSARAISNLLALGKPIVWTMHDQNPFTGGCHYTDGCDEYLYNCDKCPQLVSDTLGLPSLFLSEKKHCLGLERNNLSAIFPSNWLRDCAANSPLFQKKILEVIPNSVDTQAFQPMPKNDARKLLGLPECGFVILFVASDMNESRKGLDILNESLRVAIEGPLRDLHRQDNILLLMAGHPASHSNNTPPLKYLSLDFMNDKERLRLAYCSADIMAHCSREDNLPNTIIESMGCGLPTIAYDVGGCKDIIDHAVNGYLIPEDDHRAFADTLAKLATSSDQREKVRDNCLRTVSSKYTAEIQAKAYLNFFKRMLAQNIDSRAAFSQQPDQQAVSSDLREEILRRILAGYKRLPVGGGIELVNNWLHNAPSGDSIYYLTSPREYQHEETGYDAQYGIEHDDFTYGNGLCNLMISHKCDLSAPALEIGCGTGILTLGICQKNPFPLFIASDASPAFLHIVKNKLEQTGNFTERVRLAVIDGDALTHAPKQSFSLIVLKATLHHIIDPGQFIKKTSELLVPNGMLVFHEPFWEGSVLLGLMAQTLMDKKYSRFSRKLWRGVIRAFTSMPNRYTRKVTQESHFVRLQLLIDTMKAAARRDIDKSTWEDKHLFKVSDIMKWGHGANLDVDFIPNREFNEFADNADNETFSYRKFIFTYISKCMNYGDQFARDFEADMGTSFDYLDQIAANNNSPEYHGIFLFRKR